MIRITVYGRERLGVVLADGRSIEPLTEEEAYKLISRSRGRFADVSITPADRSPETMRFTRLYAASLSAWPIVIPEDNPCVTCPR